MTRRALGMGPTASKSAAEATGERLLPVERLFGPQKAGETSAGEQRAPEGVRQSGRRMLHRAPERAGDAPDTAV
ncbi:hypothetical protein ACFY3N_31590 [Streptomyces sp. NPDC000348]|uniref:hypothetical protein n=1 Tax=Streptomyces sp. NPDC000348 TaxID=3364538 RepID=UPI0036A4A18C